MLCCRLFFLLSSAKNLLLCLCRFLLFCSLPVLLVVIPQGSASVFAVACPFGCCLFLLAVIPQGSASVFAFAF
jgi:diacylglycerol kinase family enzyme